MADLVKYFKDLVWKAHIQWHTNQDSSGGRLVRLGGSWPPPLEISAVDRAIAAKICTMVVCDVIYKTIYLDFQQKKSFILYQLIMLIHARNQTFCSRSVNKYSSKIVDFGIDTLCSILSNSSAFIRTVVSAIFA